MGRVVARAGAHHDDGDSDRRKQPVRFRPPPPRLRRVSSERQGLLVRERKRTSLRWRPRRFDFPGRMRSESRALPSGKNTLSTGETMIRRTAIKSAFAIATTLLLSLTAHAQLFRAYVSSTGSDTNPCTLPAPCRLLPAALAAVANGGEIWMLDSANYNTATVVIDKSVSILAIPGAVGSVVAIGTSAIDIYANSLKVALRNLVVVPLPGPPTSYGIYMSGASSLTIEDSLLANLVTGVYVEGTGTVAITNSILRNFENWGVFARNGARVSISGTKMLGILFGPVYASSLSATTTTAIISDSIISGRDFGVYAFTNNAGGSVRVFVTRCTIESAQIALRSETNDTGSALITVSGSTITNNNYGWYLVGTGSMIKSLGNNHIEDNVFSPVGTLTLAALQ